ncbi:MAG: hypothetical protein P4L99_01355 [Chthoniobacter sp.]|nr:hypothetical protein [Chthoniobacter sp.]
MTNTITNHLTTLCNTPIELGRNYLSIPEETTDSELHAIGNGLRDIQGSNLFWCGDYLLALENRKGAHYAKQHEAMHYAPGTLHQAKYVCRNLPPHVRNSCSFTHHREALVETAGNPVQAVEFLKRAEAQNLTVSQMRKTIRLELHPPAPKDEMPIVQDSEFLTVLDAVKTIARYLMKTDSKTLGIVKQYLLAEIETLFENARALAPASLLTSPTIFGKYPPRNDCIPHNKRANSLPAL